MSFEGVKFNKGEYGLDRTNASTDAVMAIVIHTPVEGGGNYREAIRCIQPSDLDAVGYNASYDANNNVLLRHHVNNFFAYAPLGTLYVIPTDDTTAAQFFNDTQVSALFRELTDVKRIGFVYNDDILDLDLEAEANVCQLFINNLEADNIRIDGIYLEARNIGKDASDLRVLTAPNVSAVIAQDKDIAILDDAYAKYADIGAVLGMRAIRKVNENIGSVDVINKPDGYKSDISYSLTRPLTGKFLGANLSDGTAVTSLTSVEKLQLTSRGYIYAGSFQGFAGYYFNGEPTAVELASDYSTGENNGVWNKAARGIRTALLPKVRGWFQRNKDTGNLRASAIVYLENIAKQPLDTMVGEEEISGYEISIPKNQSPNDLTLLVKVKVRLGAIIHEFTVDLSLN